MAVQPKLEIGLYHGEGKYNYAVFRVDRPSPICFGISRAHAEHVVKLLKTMPEVPEKFTTIAEWQQYDEPLSDSDIERLGLTIIGNKYD